MLRIPILLFDGFDELDALAAFEMFKAAGRQGWEVGATCVTLKSTAEVRGAHGLRLRPEAALVTDPPPSLLLVPGGGWLADSPHGVKAEIQRGAIPAALAALHQKGTTLACVSTGAKLPAATGLLKGRPSTTHHSARDALNAAGATVVDARVVDDGTVITSGGVTSGLDLVLWVLERWLGPQAAHQVERLLEVERRGTV